MRPRRNKRPRTHNTHVLVEHPVRDSTAFRMVRKSALTAVKLDAVRARTPGRTGGSGSCMAHRSP